MQRVRDMLGNGRFNINMKIGNIPDRRRASRHGGCSAIQCCRSEGF
jgi:hypothetical protein